MISYAFAEEKTRMECLIVPLFEDKKPSTLVKELDEVFEGIFNEVVEMKDFEGKRGELSLLYTKDNATPRVLLVGLGKQKELTIRKYKQVIGAAVMNAQSKKMNRIGCVAITEGEKMWGAKKMGLETVVSIEVANYSFDTYKQKDAHVTPIKSVYIVGDLDTNKKKQWEKGIEEGQRIAAGVNMTRRLGNIPPHDMTPTYLAKEAENIGKEYKKVKVKVLSKPEIKKHKMGCLLGVAKGSEMEPKFIILEYKGTDKPTKPTVLVGKGITFDSGGLSLKPGAYMTDMKFDMLGAATVLGIFRAIAALGIKKHVVGLIASCENMPGPNAYRPDDILTAMNGKTVEVKNTDAEGRLVLADALSYASRYEPKEVIDFATLTGACLVALGNERSGLFSPEQKIVDKLISAANDTGEQLWHLPVGEEYSKAMDSLVADIKNTGGVGNPLFGGASTAAAFLQFFTDYPWAHIDLGSSYYSDKGRAWIRHGANGFGVQTLVDYLR